MILKLFYTGYDPSMEKITFFDIMKNASGSASVLYSVIIALIVSSVFYMNLPIPSYEESSNVQKNTMLGSQKALR